MLYANLGSLGARRDVTFFWEGYGANGFPRVKLTWDESSLSFRIHYPTFHNAVYSASVNLNGTSVPTKNKSDNVYITGYFSTGVDFGGGSINISSTDAYLAKYTSDGIFLWVTTVGAVGFDQSQSNSGSNR